MNANDLTNILIEAFSFLSTHVNTFYHGHTPLSFSSSLLFSNGKPLANGINPGAEPNLTTIYYPFLFKNPPPNQKKKPLLSNDQRTIIDTCNTCTYNISILLLVSNNPRQRKIIEFTKIQRRKLFFFSPPPFSLWPEEGSSRAKS